jgi:uncharacterized protein (DUF934 family)
MSEELTKEEQQAKDNAEFDIALKEFLAKGGEVQQIERRVGPLLATAK